MGLEHDVVKVLDFGLVQVIGPGPGHDLTQSLAALDGVVGSPAFMAPEVILGQQAVDHRADIYALGCVAYFLLTGQHVFQGGTQMQALIDHVSTAPAPPSSRVSIPIPRSVEALVLACLEKDPERRPADARALSLRLAECDGAREWSDAQAARWWQTYLPGLEADPAAVAEAATRARDGVRRRAPVPPRGWKRKYSRGGGACRAVDWRRSPACRHCRHRRPHLVAHRDTCSVAGPRARRGPERRS